MEELYHTMRKRDMLKPCNLCLYINRTLEYDSFAAVIIFGSKGSGKSTYAIKALAHYYHYVHGLKFRDAYQKALQHIGFTAFDVIKLIEEGKNIIIWDDAGVWLSTYMWFDEKYRRYLEKFLDYYDVIRTDTGVILFTTVSKKKLPPKVREDPSVVLVKMSIISLFRDSYGRKWKVSRAEAAQNIELLHRDTVVRPTLFYDIIRVRLPDTVYYRYLEMRKKYTKYAREEFKKAAKEAFKEVYITLSE